ncbi:threonine synthase [Fodinicurvata sp. EGI_FJ10296]|uniref:threonine synthase n=1 Tax=Fodinicurvata sp. EGI_FJ10296 TaxID=3231908 RepID=UPI0034520CD1
MPAETLRCISCGETVSIALMPSTCASCGGILNYVGPAATHGRDDGTDADHPADPNSLWQWAEFLPHCAPANRITLGEARSPLLECGRIGRDAGLADFWIKNDSVMPTGSFKDRAIALAVSLALEHGREGLVLSSSGNAGASGAAYAARAGLPIVVLVPETAPAAKLRQIAITGARLVTVAGATSDCCRMAAALAAERGWVNLTTTFHNPYGVDGYATIAYELAPLKPDVVLLPISSGPLLAGVMKGFEAMKAAGRIGRIPRPVAIQAAACAPIAKAFAEGGDVSPWQHRATIASALNDTLAGYERDGDYTLHWIRKYGGAATAVDDDAIADAVRRLARREGIVLEPSAAVPIAALSDLRERGIITPGERVVAVATGHGLKDLSCAPEPDLEAPISADAGSDAVLTSI